MDLPPAWCQVCVCGRTFSVLQAYTFHKRSCQKTKKRLSGALDKAKAVWQSKKRRKMEVMQTPTAENPLEQTASIEQESNEAALALQHEVRLLMLVPLIAHQVVILSVRVPPRTTKTWISHWQSAGVAEKTADYPSATGIYYPNLQQPFPHRTNRSH